MSADTAGMPLTTVNTRIHITRRAARWRFVNRFLPKFIRQGGTYLLLADVRRRIRRRRNLM